MLYQVSTGNLNKAVNRNLDRFPEDFMFQLRREEFNNLMFQNGTSSWAGTRKLARAFAEQGVAMLSSVLRSKRAGPNTCGEEENRFPAPREACSIWEGLIQILRGWT